MGTASGELGFGEGDGIALAADADDPFGAPEAMALLFFHT